jgi:hypothetical protein
MVYRLISAFNNKATCPHNHPTQCQYNVLLHHRACMTAMRTCRARGAPLKGWLPSQLQCPPGRVGTLASAAGSCQENCNHFTFNIFNFGKSCVLIQFLSLKQVWSQKWYGQLPIQIPEVQKLPWIVYFLLDWYCIRKTERCDWHRNS